MSSESDPPAGTSPSEGERDPNRPLPTSRIVPAIDPAGPLEPGLRLPPEALAAQASAPPPPPSRRFVLGTAGLVLLGAGAGVGYSFWRTRNPPRRAAPPALLAAAHAERVLVATLDSAIARFPGQSGLLQQLRADHAAHSAALDAAVDAHTGHPPAHPTAAVTSTGHLVDTERRAAQAAGQRAAALTGRDAALLASIAACEATHVELLR